MHLYLIDGYLDVAATTLADAKVLLAALANPATSANIATIDRITGQIETLVASDTGEPLTISSIDDVAGTISSWVTDATQTIAFGIGDPDPTNAATYAATEEFTISGSTRIGNIALNTSALQAALAGSRGMPPRGGSSQFTAHIRRTNAAGYTETLALLPIQVTQGVLQQDPIDHEFATIASYVQSAAASAAGATVSANAASGSAASALDSKNEAADSEAAALASAQAAALSQVAAAASQSSASSSALSATGSASSATASALSATASASSATSSASTASTAAATASSAATTATGAILSTYLGVIAGASVPATATAAGYWYRISTGGPSQGKTWVTGDIASYAGTSGNWSQISGGVVDANELAYKVNSRAPAQGLVFDGPAGATVSGVPAFGTGDFTVAGTFKTASLASGQIIFGGATNAFGLNLLTDGTLTSTLVNVGDNTASSGVVATGKNYSFAYVRSGTTGTYYLNGVAVGTTTDSRNYSVAITGFGGLVSAAPFNGFLRLLAIENRALSASEILALYERGVVDPSDINNASNTAINTAAWTNYLSTYTSFTGESATGFTAVQASGDAYAAISPIPYSTKGQVFLISGTLTLNNGKTVKPTVYIDNGGVGFVLTEGTFSNIATAAAAGSNRIIFTTTGDANYTLSNLSVTRLGLLLAPEQSAPGNGYQWKDMSGNKADITLPVSGVSWALPDRRPNSVRGTLTWSGSHEGKSLIGQRALPTGAVVTMITRTASAVSAGSGCTVGTTGTATKWQAADTFTTAKEVSTLAAQLPTDDTANQNDIVIDPDTQNFTGSIAAEVHYTISE